ADKNRCAAGLQVQKEEYSAVHKSLLAARRSKSLLIGDYDMQTTTPSELEEVCAAIVKATRKVHLALAMHQLQQQRSGNDMDPNGSSLGLRGGAVNDPLCIVCFENMWNTSLSPCGHVLCADCSARLKYCPSCRHPIQQLFIVYMRTTTSPPDTSPKRKSRRFSEDSTTDQSSAEPVLFLDCDDTLYWKDRREVGRLLTENIGKYIHENFGLDSSAGYSLYSKYGTCIKGLIEEGYIDRNDQAEIYRYFDETHAIRELRELIPPDHAVRQTISRIGVPKWVLTVGPMKHCLRCLNFIGVRDLLPNVIDTAMCQFETKRKSPCYRIAMEIAGVEDPSACILVDDSPANLEAAKQVGWRTVLVNPDSKLQGPFPGVDYVVDNVTLLPTVVPECFDPATDSEASSDDEIVSVSMNLYTGKRSRHIESIDTAPSESQFPSFGSDGGFDDE
ncbi:hypothetical protein FOL47_008492, partial [Perkinsus chesapeaki]